MGDILYHEGPRELTNREVGELNYGDDPRRHLTNRARGDTDFVSPTGRLYKIVPIYKVPVLITQTGNWNPREWSTLCPVDSGGVLSFDCRRPLLVHPPVPLIASSEAQANAETGRYQQHLAMPYWPLFHQTACRCGCTPHG